MKMTQFSPRPLLVTAVSLNGAHQTSHEAAVRETKLTSVTYSKFNSKLNFRICDTKH